MSDPLKTQQDQPEDDIPEYKIRAEEMKDEGNIAFQLGTEEGVKRAIECYSQAIELDPDNHVYYSNRSAAYLKADSKSKALYDAEKCVELAPEWIKGYSRLGAALQSLKRFEAAMDTFKKVFIIY
jgi:stress-induced-phosphoprotein 1